MSSDIGSYTDSSFKTNNDHLNSDSDSIITPNENITPIKFVNQTSNKLDKVVTGVGTCNTISAVPQLIKYGVQTAKRVWRVLLDSRSDGDLLFVHPSNKERIPQKECFAPQKWPGKLLMVLPRQQK